MPAQESAALRTIAPEATGQELCFRFLDLSKELQLEIVYHVIPQRNIFFTVVRGVLLTAKTRLIDLLLSCRQIYDMTMFHFRCAYDINPAPGCLWPVQGLSRLHRGNDTLCIVCSTFPSDALSRHLRDPRKLTYRCTCINPPKYALVDVPKQNAFVVPAERIINRFRSWLSIGVDENAPKDYDPRFSLDAFPNPKEATLIIATVPRSYEIPGLHKFLTQDWGFFDGTRWKQDMIRDEDARADNIGTPFIEQRWDLEKESLYFFEDAVEYEEYQNNTWVQRRIGHHRYTDSAVSHSGLWAGFRLFTKTGVVQFTPLDWWDFREAFQVNEIMAHVCDVSFERKTLMPDHVTRLWIDPSDDFGSQYNWINVERPADADDETMQGTIMTWAIIRDHPQRQRISLWCRLE